MSALTKDERELLRGMPDAMRIFLRTMEAGVASQERDLVTSPTSDVAMLVERRQQLEGARKLVAFFKAAAAPPKA